jgi:hypothetical protein
MNRDIDETIPPFPDAACEREWLAQEEAMRREQHHLDPAADEVQIRRYRRLARVLREPLDAVLPPDFARQVAARVAVRPQPAMDVRFERSLTFALGITLALAAMVVTVVYGKAWLSPIIHSLPALHLLTGRWLLAFAACIAVSWLLGAWQRPAPSSPPA